MPLPENDPFQFKDTTLKYYAYKHPKLFRCLNILLCPFTCGCIYCCTVPSDHLAASDRMYNGLSVQKRMADRHFAREGRKFNRRNSLSNEKPIGRLARVFKSRKELSKQTCSPLFSKLPHEIRIEIFKQVLFNTGAVFIDTVRIKPDNWDSFHKIHAQACELDLGTPPGLGDLSSVGPDLLTRNSRLDLALLQTCRLAYIEALPILYAQTQFVFKYPRNLVAFSHSIPPTHFTQIRSIRMEFSKISNYHEYRRDQEKIVYYDTFVTPLRRPMQEYFRVIRSMRRLHSIYIIFKITNNGHERQHYSHNVDLSDANFSEMLAEMQEYHERTRGATTTQCRVHFLVYNRSELVCQKTERGLMDLDQAGVADK